VTEARVEQNQLNRLEAGQGQPLLENSEPPRPFISENYLRPRYAETDAQGVVYHANYIVWFEVARGEYCRAIGYPYLAIEQEGYGFMVTDLSVKYLSPAYYDDEIVIKTWVEKTGRASCVFGYQIYNKTTGKICVEGMSKHAAVSREGKLVRFSQTLYETIKPLVGRGPTRLAPLA
jgi:acyl-CoA thioester hydrolase